MVTFWAAFHSNVRRSHCTRLKKSKRKIILFMSIQTLSTKNIFVKFKFTSEAVLRLFLRLPLKIKTTTGQPKSFNFPTAKLMIRSRGSESQCDQMVFQNFMKNLIYLHRKCAQVYKIGQSRYETKNKLFKMLSATFKNYPKSTISPNLVTLVTEKKNRPMQFMSTLSRGMWTGDIRLRLCGKNELHSVLPDWAIFEKSWQQIFVQWKPKYLVPLWDISIF